MKFKAVLVFLMFCTSLKSELTVFQLNNGISIYEVEEDQVVNLLISTLNLPPEKRV